MNKSVLVNLRWPFLLFSCLANFFSSEEYIFLNLLIPKAVIMNIWSMSLKIYTNRCVQINKDLSRMKRFNAQEALEYGLIDRIARPPRIKADAPPKEAGTGLG